MLKIMKNKKADLAVTLLVFMAVALAGAASIIFISSDRKIEERIADARFIDEIYMTEEKLNFYIDEIMEKAIEDFKLENNEEKFIDNFKNELNKYRENNGYVIWELGEVEKQIDEKHVKIENNKVIAEFNFIISVKREPFTAVYHYRKTFEKEIRNI